MNEELPPSYPMKIPDGTTYGPGGTTPRTASQSGRTSIPSHLTLTDKTLMFSDINDWPKVI